jgi:hypothetical protein
VDKSIRFSAKRSNLILPKEFSMVVSNIKIVKGATGASNYRALLLQLGVEQNSFSKTFGH